ncbi:MAG: hypothetical protein KUA37_01940 [Desulfomicrobium sp.]|nr:hypothetical protein [Pseudomonadota bacterium]MBV1710752.1 hypothetical protein [Desulfomicrobium sp.]MBU4570360.1 hypothetical protein [Pseudomonadota bacterium]MBU4593281.1 hypothetical protein [Pseudomonadota bacterium]MBV1719834.1 hypothetical protein [Desulfomicrobium sp.]
MKYHVIAHGGTTDDFEKGLKKSLRLAMDGESKELLIKVCQLANTRGIMSNVMGEKLINQLIKSRQISIKTPECTIHIFLETKRANHSNFTTGTVFAPWLTLPSLEETMNDFRTVNSVYVPWQEKELEDYIAVNPTSTAI